MILLEPLQESKGKLEDAYITNLHMGVITHELKSELERETWMAVEDISYQLYTPMFNYIFNKGQPANVQASFNNSFI